MQETYHWDGGGVIYWLQMDREGGGEGWLKERSSLL